jgi:hypothetical protein
MTCHTSEKFHMAILQQKVIAREKALNLPFNHSQREDKRSDKYFSACRQLYLKQSPPSYGQLDKCPWTALTDDDY